MVVADWVSFSPSLSAMVLCVTDGGVFCGRWNRPIPHIFLYGSSILCSPIASLVFLVPSHPRTMSSSRASTTSSVSPVDWKLSLPAATQKAVYLLKTNGRHSSMRSLVKGRSVTLNSTSSSDYANRTLLCILVVIGLWSAAYGPIPAVTHYSLGRIDLPCPDVLWSASSPEQWKALSNTIEKPPCWQDTVESLLSDVSHQSSGLSSLCLLVGLLLYTDELREGSSMSSNEIHDHIKEALDNWQRQHHSETPEGGIIYTIAQPAAVFLRISFLIDIRGAMACFLRQDLHGMRSLLRKGDLRNATREALSLLSPLCTSPYTQVSMVAIPCGESH